MQDEDGEPEFRYSDHSVGRLLGGQGTARLT
jgi:hypothetical protein